MVWPVWSRVATPRSGVWPRETTAGVMKIYTPRKYGHPGVQFLRNFRDPVVIIGTPFSTQTADDTGDAYDSGGYSLQVKNSQV